MALRRGGGGARGRPRRRDRAPARRPPDRAARHLPRRQDHDGPGHRLAQPPPPAADPALRRLALRPGRRLPGALPILLPRRLPRRPADRPRLRQPAGGAGRTGARAGAGGCDLPLRRPCRGGHHLRMFLLHRPPGARAPDRRARHLHPPFRRLGRRRAAPLHHQVRRRGAAAGAAPWRPHPHPLLTERGGRRAARGRRPPHGRPPARPAADGARRLQGRPDDRPHPAPAGLAGGLRPAPGGRGPGAGRRRRPGSHGRTDHPPLHPRNPRAFWKTGTPAANSRWTRRCEPAS